MLRDEIENIIDILLSMNTVFDSGFVHNSRDKTRGLGQIAGNYFYIVENVGTNGFNGSIEKQNKDFYVVSENWKLIVSIKCVDRFQILKILIGQLLLKTPGISIDVTGYSTDAESIFFEETGFELASNIDIIRINITVRKGVTTSGLDCGVICDTDCC